MNKQHLNLSRLYRITQFGDVVGQDLIVRMLQNSLYTNQIFPVYLMSGKHGCGKTSVARIFASAANCYAGDSFRLNPKSVNLPCLECQSCNAMSEGIHPDFIEIDAASHTGVDMIRNLIENASFLPVMGSYKIYLIDEAHMLSKAAFNALLKILEDPPKSVFFILATTDMQKIPETVRSRCFQLFFKPVNIRDLGDYLKKICNKICFSYTPDGISAILNYSGGSVRDALNVIERIRYASQTIDQDSVRSVIGFIDDALLFEMIQAVWCADMNYFKDRFFSIFSSNVSVGLVWGRLIFVFHEMLKIKTGIVSDRLDEQLEEVSHKVSLGFIYNFLNMLFDYEPLLLKTSAPIILLHTIVLKNIRNVYKDELSSNQQNNSCNEGLSSDGVIQGFEQKPLLKIDDDHEEFKALWMVFLKKIECLGDPLLYSLFIKIVSDFDKLENKINLLFATQEEFLKDLLVEHEKKWIPLLHEVFGSEVSFILSCSLTKDTQSFDHKKTNVIFDLQGEIKKKSDNDVSQIFFESSAIPSVKTVLKYFPGQVLFFES